MRRYVEEVAAREEKIKAQEEKIARWGCTANAECSRPIARESAWSDDSTLAECEVKTWFQAFAFKWVNLGPLHRGGRRRRRRGRAPSRQGCTI
jgi:hypothetical protein